MQRKGVCPHRSCHHCLPSHPRWRHPTSGAAFRVFFPSSLGPFLATSTTVGGHHRPQVLLAAYGEKPGAAPLRVHFLAIGGPMGDKSHIRPPPHITSYPSNPSNRSSTAANPRRCQNLKEKSLTERSSRPSSITNKLCYRRCLALKSRQYRYRCCSIRRDHRLPVPPSLEP